MAPLQTPDATEQLASRHEPHLFTTPTLPVDPYLAWCEQREARGASTSETIRSRYTRLVRRHQPPKEPWEKILVKLSGQR